jgi:hypothetical protein
MAQTTLLPKRATFNENIKKSQKTLLNTQSNIVNLSKLLKERKENREKISSSILTERKKREYATIRQESEDELEAKRIASSPNISSGVNLVPSSGSFIDRIVNTLGYLAAGWILRNLPTWEGMAKEFIARLQEAGRIIGSFVTGAIRVFQASYSLITGAIQNLKNFDLTDSSNNIRNSFDELVDSINDMGSELEAGVKLITTPLTQTTEDGRQVGSYSREEIPALGSTSTDMGAYAESAPSSSGGTSNSGSYKELLDMIAGVESTSYGGYEAFNRGGSNNGYTAHGSGNASKVAIGGKVKPLTQRTVKEVMDLQARGELHATGRYQIIQSTLAGLIGGSYGPTGVKPSDLYDATTQDKLGIALIKYRLRTGANVSNFISEWRGLKFSNSKKLQGAIDRANAAYKKNPNSTAVSVVPQQSLMTSTSSNVGTGKAIFGETGRVSNAAGWVHGHFQTNTGTANDLVNDTAPIVKGLVDAGIPAELSRGQKFTKNMSMDEIKQLIRVGISQHGHSGDGRSVDIFVPKGTKVPFPVYDVRDTGGRGGITAILPGTGKVWVGHLDPKSKSGTKPTEKTESLSPTQVSPQPQAQTPPPAQISQTPSQQSKQQLSQTLTPERKAQDIVAIIPEQQGQSPPAQMPQPSMSRPSPSVSMGTLLNNFMKQKLLLDLSYV